MTTSHEIKFDGFRMHARIVSGAAALLTRNGLDWTANAEKLSHQGWPSILLMMGSSGGRGDVGADADDRHPHWQARL